MNPCCDDADTTRIYKDQRIERGNIVVAHRRPELTPTSNVDSWSLE
ncbi:MAG: hypothetical protein KDB27_28725 [Planctomycetales bacterium]|nr:hypothetical protein [Planctomycetales bacterium]